MTTPDLNALIELLDDLIAEAEADMIADAADAEETGERVDLYEYEIELPLEVAKRFAQALRARQPVQDDVGRLITRLSADLAAAEKRGEWQHVAYFDEGQFHWMSGIAPRDCELYAQTIRSRGE